MANETLDWLREECTNHLLAEKWLIAQDQRSAQTWKDRIALAGTATVNLYGRSLQSSVFSLVNLWVTENGLSVLSSLSARSLLLDLLQQRWRRGGLKYFVDEAYAESLAALLNRSFRDLRLAGVEPSQLTPQSFCAEAKGADLRALYADYIDALHERQLIDYAGCLQHATLALAGGRLPFADDLRVLLPEAWLLAPLEQLFLLSLEKRVTVRRWEQAEFDSQRFDSQRTRERITTNSSTQRAAFEYFTGHGEVNEVRGVVQRILHDQQSGGCRLDDVEIAHTDSATYVPLIYELFATVTARRLAWPADDANAGAATSSLSAQVQYVVLDPARLPVTFAEGIACVYARPGRALRAWLRWSRVDCVQSKLVQMLREGLLARPTGSDTIGYARLASNLRRLPIGFEGGRYLPAIEQAIDEATKRQAEYIEQARSQKLEEADEESPRDFGLPVLQALHQIVRPLVELAPDDDATPEAILQNAKRFLKRSARSESQLDRLARNQLLEEIDGRLAAIALTADDAAGVLHWLEELPVETSVLASGPQPGRVHVAPIDRSGISGRRRMFVVGLDSGRFPKRRSVDPFLLDDERTRLSAGLSTSVQLAAERQAGLLRLLDRSLESSAPRITLSFSTRNLMEDRGLDPSPSLVEVYRLTENRPEAHPGDLLQHCGRAVSFASMDEAEWLDPADRWLAGYLLEPDPALSTRQLEHQWLHFGEQRIASEQYERDDFTEYDGLVAEAGPGLCPANSDKRISASRLETFGTCPRRFFFKYGLGVYPPDNWDVDPEQWLDALQTGSLLHELFEEFLRELTAAGRTPDRQRDWPRLRDQLHQKLDVIRSQYPIPNQDAFLRDRDKLEDMCDTFLEKEQEYCGLTGARPWIVEASVGLGEPSRSELDAAEPVHLTLSDGRLLRVGGRIDRIDRFQQNGSECYAIWDYKTGSAYGYDAGEPFQQGRKLQPFLYVGLLRHRLSAIGSGPDPTVSFGYFFPSSKAAGLRIQWTMGELRSGDEILRHICDLIQAGAFPATTHADDCTYCDYQTVCYDIARTTTDSLRKTMHPVNRQLLAPWKTLRDAT